MKRVRARHAVLIRQADLLLLDEPTNYLDLEEHCGWSTYLSRYPASVIRIIP